MNLSSRFGQLLKGEMHQSKKALVETLPCWAIPKFPSWEKPSEQAGVEQPKSHLIIIFCNKPYIQPGSKAFILFYFILYFILFYGKVSFKNNLLILGLILCLRNAH